MSESNSTSLPLLRGLRRLGRRARMSGVPMEDMRYFPYRRIASQDSEQHEDGDAKMCNVDYREKCAICKEVLGHGQGHVNFLIKRKPCHKDCFEEYMKKTEVMI